MIWSHSRVRQGRDGVVDESHDTLEMLLAARDVFVEVRTLEAVSLEELREDARVRVDHIPIETNMRQGEVCLELVQRQKGRGVLLKLLVEASSR